MFPSNLTSWGMSGKKRASNAYARYKQIANKGPPNKEVTYTQSFLDDVFTSRSLQKQNLRHGFVNPSALKILD